jgi:hypothetical protein
MVSTPGHHLAGARIQTARPYVQVPVASGASFIRRLPRQQFDVVDPDTTAPVEVVDHFPGQGNRLRETHPDGSTRQNVPDSVFGQRGLDEQYRHA